MSLESFKRELAESAAKGRDAARLLDVQADIIKDMKIAIADEIANTSVRKGKTGSSITLSGLEVLEDLRAEMRVVSDYEDALRFAINNGEMAKANLEDLNSR